MSTLDKSNNEFDLKSISARDILIYFFSLAAGFGLLIYTFRGVSISDVGEELKRINFFYLTLFMGIIFLGTFLRALRWKYMIVSFKENVRIKNLFEATVIGYGVNVILPRFGEVARSLYLGASEKISRSSALGTIVVERVFDLIFLILSVVISLCLFGDELSSKYPWIYNAIYFGILILLFAFISLFLVIKFQNKIIDLIERLFNTLNLKIFNRASEITSKVIEGFDSIKTRKNYLMTFLLSPVLWFTYALGSYVGLLALNMHKIIQVDFASGLIIMSITTFGIMVPIPGSTGSYHAFCKSVLTMVLGFDVKISLAYAVLTHLLNTIPFVIISLIILFKKGIKKSFS
ncbi:MAG: flippase-like domain-containing protein [Ignavibacteria bacterium]|nr:flippase-like domain-containing protein [Ignavibacteria bacterium]